MTNPAMTPAARNSPCPCGSGKRYKECHGAIDAADGGTSGETPATPPLRRSHYRAPGTEWAHLSAEEQDELGVAMEAALVHQRAGQPQEAGTLYRKTLALAPNTHDALHMLGVIELGFGNLQLAEELILRAMKLRPPYDAIETNLKLVGKKLIEQPRATEEQLSERALPILNDLMLAPAASRRANANEPGSGTLHLVGRIHGEDEDDAWMLGRLGDVLAPFSPTVWAADSATSVPWGLGTLSVLDARTGQYPRGGAGFVGVDYEVDGWIEHSRAERVIVICGRGRPSRYLTQLRALAMDGARRVELAFVSRSRAERFGPGHALIPLPLESISVPMAIASTQRELGVWSICEPRAWTIGMVGQTSGCVEEPTDSALVAEVATCANVIAIYDPGRYRFFLGATKSMRFVPRTSGGLEAFIASVDCLYCRPQLWWEEGAGREVLIAMALGKPVVCPRNSMHAWLIEDRVDGLLYETRAEIARVAPRSPSRARLGGQARRSCKRQSPMPARCRRGRGVPIRSIVPATRVSAGEERHAH